MKFTENNNQRFTIQDVIYTIEKTAKSTKKYGTGSSDTSEANSFVLATNSISERRFSALKKIKNEAEVAEAFFRSSHPEVFLRKGVLKICRKFTGEHPCRSVTAIKLLCNFIEITLLHRCSSVNLLHIFRTPFPKSISGGLLLIFFKIFCNLIFTAIIKSSFYNSNFTRNYFGQILFEKDLFIFTNT